MVSMQDMLPVTPMLGTHTVAASPKQLPDPTPAKASRLGPMQQSGSSSSLIHAWAPGAGGSPVQVNPTVLHTACLLLTPPMLCK